MRCSLWHTSLRAVVFSHLCLGLTRSYFLQFSHRKPFTYLYTFSCVPHPRPPQSLLFGRPNGKFRGDKSTTSPDPQVRYSGESNAVLCSYPTDLISRLGFATSTSNEASHCDFYFGRPPISSILGGNSFLGALFWNIFIVCSALQAMLHVSHPCKTESEILIPYILVFL